MKFHLSNSHMKILLDVTIKCSLYNFLKAFYSKAEVILSSTVLHPFKIKYFFSTIVSWYQYFIFFPTNSTLCTNFTVLILITSGSRKNIKLSWNDNYPLASCIVTTFTRTEQVYAPQVYGKIVIINAFYFL